MARTYIGAALAAAMSVDELPASWRRPDKPKPADQKKKAKRKAARLARRRNRK